MLLLTGKLDENMFDKIKICLKHMPPWREFIKLRKTFFDFGSERIPLRCICENNGKLEQPVCLHISALLSISCRVPHFFLHQHAPMDLPCIFSLQNPRFLKCSNAMVARGIGDLFGIRIWLQLPDDNSEIHNANT